MLAEIQRLLKTLREQKAECDKTIRSLKDQYDRDVKNVLNSNRKSIDQLQREHTDQLRQLEERHDSTVKILQDELRKSLSSQEIPTRDMPPVKKDVITRICHQWKGFVDLRCVSESFVGSHFLRLLGDAGGGTDHNDLGGGYRGAPDG